MLPLSAAMLKLPSRSVDVPMVLPLTITATPGRGDESSAENTLPLRVSFCAQRSCEASNAIVVNKKCFILL